MMLASVVNLFSDKKETGRENAQRFVKALREIAEDQRVIAMHRAYDRRKSQHYGWTWMDNPYWQTLVMDLILEQDVHVTDCQFHPADNKHDWTFSCISVRNVSKSSLLNLDDTL